MATQLATLDSFLNVLQPRHDYTQALLTSAIQAVLSSRPDHITSDKGMLKVMRNGSIEIDSVPYLDIVIVGVYQPRNDFSRSLYLTDYDPANPKAPDCSSADGITPDVENPINPTCQGCPYNVKRDPNDNAPRTCKRTKHLAVVLKEDVIADVDNAKPLQLVLSIKAAIAGIGEVTPAEKNSMKMKLGLSPQQKVEIYEGGYHKWRDALVSKGIPIEAITFRILYPTETTGIRFIPDVTSQFDPETVEKLQAIGMAESTQTLIDPKIGLAAQVSSQAKAATPPPQTSVGVKPSAQTRKTVVDDEVPFDADEPEVAPAPAAAAAAAPAKATKAASKAATAKPAAVKPKPAPEPEPESEEAEENSADDVDYDELLDLDF